MDMREMVDKVKRNEPLYGKSSLTPYMQGVASRNSRYSGIWLHVIPWFNFVNHDQVLFSLARQDIFNSLILYSTASTRLNTTDRQRESLLQSKLAAHKNSQDKAQVGVRSGCEVLRLCSVFVLSGS